MTDEVKVNREVIELAIGAGSFMIALQFFCISLLVESWGALWATFGLVALCFSLLWCFDDVLFGNKKSRKRAGTR